MIIRSQDRKTICNFNQTEKLKVSNDYEILAIAYDNVILLGQYNSQKRALEILDEIQKRYSEFNGMFGVVVYDNLAYEMPIE